MCIWCKRSVPMVEVVSPSCGMGEGELCGGWMCSVLHASQTESAINFFFFFYWPWPRYLPKLEASLLCSLLGCLRWKLIITTGFLPSQNGLLGGWLYTTVRMIRPRTVKAGWCRMGKKKIDHKKTFSSCKQWLGASALIYFFPMYTIALSFTTQSLHNLTYLNKYWTVWQTATRILLDPLCDIHDCGCLTIWMCLLPSVVVDYNKTRPLLYATEYDRADSKKKQSCYPSVLSEHVRGHVRFGGYWAL